MSKLLIKEIKCCDECDHFTMPPSKQFYCDINGDRINNIYAINPECPLQDATLVDLERDNKNDT